MAYDIFISYRREGGEKTARLVQLILEDYGYKVFLDYDSCNASSWEKRIKAGIEESKVFLFIMSQGALDRCRNERDWVRKEVEYAYELKKNIVPINPDREFDVFPADCPELVRTALGQHSFFEIYTGQQLKTTVDALVKQRLQEYVEPMQSHETGATIYMEADMDCQIELFDKPLCALQAGVCKGVQMRKGLKKITAISMENTADRLIQKYKVESDDVDDWLQIELLPIREARLDVEEENRKKYNGHEWVDLGLPSGLKWATCNVGADKPEECGNYYAWGETETKSEYTKENCATWRKVLGDISGDSRYDAARRNWGGSWRMPTAAECQELVDNCTWTWITQGRRKGYRVTGKNGNSIFLPATGWYYGSSPDYQGELGRYWSSTPRESNTGGAYDLDFNSLGPYEAWSYRYYGLTVRPVCD